MKATKRAEAGTNTESLEQVEQRFKQWHETHKPGAHLPQGMWATAVALARKHGLNLVVRRLRVDRGRLKKRLGQAAELVHKNETEAKFVELFVPEAAGVCECVVELENARGVKMRVQLKGGDLAGFAKFGSTLWSAS